MFISIIFICVTLASFDIDYSLIFTPQKVCWMILFAAVYSVNTWLSGICWRNSLQVISENHIDLITAFNIYAKSNFGKYLPGNIMHLANRQIFAVSIGMKQTQIFQATLMELLYTCASSLLISLSITFRELISFIDTNFSPRAIKLSVVMTSVLVIALLFLLYVFKEKQIVYEIISLIRKKEFWVSMINSCFLMLILFTITGLLLAFILNWWMPISIKSTFLVIAASTVSWLIGFITPGVPGGLGVRETVLIFILSGTFGKDIVLTSALIHRVIMIAGELIAYGTGITVKMVLRKN